MSAPLTEVTVCLFSAHKVKDQSHWTSKTSRKCRISYLAQIFTYRSQRDQAPWLTAHKAGIVQWAGTLVCSGHWTYGRTHVGT